ncbi:unnamed protein product [Larinioides sclopetarius]|uniref:Phospholipase A2 n=1 Tax=Larinioides sclopetarius TaxID=280406 RepID=A0AAV1Z3W2_9ARAC
MNGKEKRFGTQCHSLFNSPFHRSPMHLGSSLLLLAWVSSLLTFVSAGKIRRRRDLLDLADMFDVLTGLDPTDYIPYGNWCGYGGQGKPIDRIDER